MLQLQFSGDMVDDEQLAEPLDLPNEQTLLIEAEPLITQPSRSPSQRSLERPIVIRKRHLCL